MQGTRLILDIFVWNYTVSGRDILKYLGLLSIGFKSVPPARILVIIIKESKGMKISCGKSNPSLRVMPK